MEAEKSVENPVLQGREGTVWFGRRARARTGVEIVAAVRTESATIGAAEYFSRKFEMNPLKYLVAKVDVFFPHAAVSAGFRRRMEVERGDRSFGEIDH